MKSKNRVVSKKVPKKVIKGRVIDPVAEATRVLKSVPSDIQMTMDSFNVVHARIALADGISPVADPSYSREKLFEIVSTIGWEATMVLLASCARLFAEVPSPLPPLSMVTKEFLHQLAKDLDARGPPMRHVDRDAAKRTKT